MTVYTGRMHDVILSAIKTFSWSSYADITVNPNAPTSHWPEDLTQAILNLLEQDLASSGAGTDREILNVNVPFTGPTS